MEKTEESDFEKDTSVPEVEIQIDKIDPPKPVLFSHKLLGSFSLDWVINGGILIFLVIVWGSSYILMKKALLFYNPEQVAALRMIFASLTLLPFAFSYIKSWNYPWFYLIVAASAGNLIPAFLFTTAQTHLSSSVAGTLNALTPMFTLVIGWWFFSTEINSFKISGVLLGLAGSGLIIASRSSDSGQSVEYQYGLLVVAATILYGLNVNVAKHYLMKMPAVVLGFLTTTLSALPCLLFLIYQNQIIEKATTPNGLKSLFYVAILGCVGSGLSTVIFYLLVKRTNALFAASGVYFTPMVAILWGLWDGEMLYWNHLVGLAALIGGLVLINRKIHYRES